MTSDWKRKTIKGSIINISKDFCFNDKETGEPKRCLRFRLQVGSDLQPCVAFGEVADEIATLGTGRELHSFEIVHRPGSEEVRVNFVLKGQTSQRDLRQEAIERKELHERQEARGFRLVPIKLRDKVINCWKPAGECSQINGRWYHNLELVMDHYGPSEGFRVVDSLRHDRPAMQAALKDLVDKIQPVAAMDASESEYAEFYDNF